MADNPVCTEREHYDIIRDFLADLPGITRDVPGDCYCLTCRQPVPFNWNKGRPKEVETDA